MFTCVIHVLNLNLFDHLNLLSVTNTQKKNQEGVKHFFTPLLLL